MDVLIEAVQHTPGRDALIIQYSARTGPYAGQSVQIHTTQTALVARIPEELQPAAGDRWGDPETAAELVAQLAAAGVTAIVVPNE